MALKNGLVQRLFKITKISSQTLSSYRISSSYVQSRKPPSSTKPDLDPEPGDNGIFCRFLHKRPIFQQALSPELQSMSLGRNLIEKLNTMDIARNRIRLDGLRSPPVEKPDETGRVTVDDARKLLKAAQLEYVKSRLRGIRHSCISYSEFLRICGENCADQDQASRIAKTLDDSATVIVLGDIVFLRPEQVAKAIQGQLPVPGGKAYEYDPLRKELEEMEKDKTAIDNKAETLVRRELWCGLGLMLAQTAAFMRLTFWELSWDVMEPICFYVTSMYFMAAYTFFLRTSKEPSFEAFYESRFSTKQKRLMKLHNFDIARYNQLRASLPPAGSDPSYPLDTSFHHHH